MLKYFPVEGVVGNVNEGKRLPIHDMVPFNDIFRLFEDDGDNFFVLLNAVE